MRVLFLFLSFLNFNLSREWYSVETTHFTVYYHKEIRDFAERTIFFLESEAYPKISELLDYKPEKKIKIVLGDFDDTGNGFAAEVFDYIFIAAADIYFIPLRGRHPWLQDVVVHELAHIFALKKIKKTPDLVPSFTIVGGFFCVMDPICRIGNPTGKATLIGSLGVAAVPYSEPAYFTEGIAQLVTSELGYDSLDSYRDMMIRTLLYHNKIYPLDKLGNFEDKFGFEGEIVYNHGFSFLVFLREKYGWETILKIMERSSDFFKFSYRKILREVIGRSLEEIEGEWVQWLKRRYSPIIDRYETRRKTGELIHVKPKKDGLYEQRMYFVSQPRSYENGLLMIQDRELVFYENREREVISGGVQSYAVQGTFIAIAYPKPTKKFFLFGLIPEIYFNVATGYLVREEKNSQKKLVIKDRKDIATRAMFPSISHDGKKIAYVKTEGDSRNLFVYEVEKGKELRLTNFTGGKQVVFPAFSPNGNVIVAAYFDGRKQDIVLIRSEVEKPIDSEDELIFITNDEWEDRDPVFIKENLISFASDKDGVFNIYVADLELRRIWKVTEELSGCLYPYPVSEEGFLYVSFEPNGYVPKRLFSPREGWELVAFLSDDVKKHVKYEISTRNQVSADQTAENKTEVLDKPNFLVDSLQTLETPQVEEKPQLGRKVEPVSFLRMILIPSVGLTLTPLLTSSSADFFVPLDIFGLSLEGLTFDVLGRMFLNFSGFMGMRGSLGLVGRLSSFHFPYFIPSLVGGFVRYKAASIMELQTLDLSSEGWTISDVFAALPVAFPLIYGDQRNFLYMAFAPLVRYYTRKVGVGGLVSVPFELLYSARSYRLIYGLGGGRVFRVPLGRLQLASEVLFSLFNTAESFADSFGGVLSGLTERYTAADVQVSVGTDYSVTIGRGRAFSIFALGRGGYSLRNVSPIDEFAETYLGYLQVFFGDSFLELTAGTAFDLWYGYINLLDTSALHGVSIVGAYSVFRFIRQLEGEKKALKLRDIVSGRFFSGLTGGVVVRASVFYRYSLIFQLLVSRGFQDPLKAPIRIYFGLGLGV